MCGPLSWADVVMKHLMPACVCACMCVRVCGRVMHSPCACLCVRACMPTVWPVILWSAQTPFAPSTPHWLFVSKATRKMWRVNATLEGEEELGAVCGEGAGGSSLTS